MTKHQIAVLACRVLGILAIIQALGMLQMVVATAGTVLWGDIAGKDAGLIIISVMIPFAIHLCFGICLWLFAERIAPYLAGDGDFNIAETKLVVEDLLTAAFSVIGMWVLVQAVIRFLQYVLNFCLIQLPASSGGYMHKQLLVQVVVLVVQFAIGLYLFLGARGLVGILRSLREAGLNKPE